MSDEVLIRPATALDTHRVTTIYGHYVRHSTATFELEAPDVTDMMRRRETLLAGGHPYLVAEVEGSVVGYAYAGPYRARPAYRFSVEDSIYLDPACVGRGVGRRLLDALIDECRTRGYRELIGIVGDSANEPSIKLHERCGFRRVGTFERVGFKFDRWLDTVLFQRHL